MSTGAQHPGGDTIVALATPHGRSGLGVVRLSGPHALAIAGALFRPRNSQPVHAMPSFTARLGDIVDGDRTVDEALLLVMRAPRSYTREDVAEFSCHGSPVTLRRIEDLCVARGARRAGPGEFTRRAYVNGRMDLAQAEAVYESVPGWHEPLDGITRYADLPGNAKAYVERLERHIGVPVRIVSIGPARHQTLIR